MRKYSLQELLTFYQENIVEMMEMQSEQLHQEYKKEAESEEELEGCFEVRSC